MTALLSEHGLNDVGIELEAESVSFAAGDAKYRVKAIGEGTDRGITALVRDCNLRRDVVLHLAKGVPGQAVIARKALAQSKLEHPNIPPIYEVGADADGDVYYTSRRIEGKRLSEMLCRKDDDETGLSRFLVILQRTCDALAFAHSAGAVHGRVSADAIVVGTYGEVLVTDWAEQCGDKTVSDDLQSLGLVLLQIVRRRRMDGQGRDMDSQTNEEGDSPWPASALRSLLPVARKSMDGGYVTVKEFQKDVETFQSGFATSAEDASFGRQLVLFLQRRKTESTWLAGVVILMVLTAGLFAWTTKRQRDRSLRLAGEADAQAELSRSNARKAEDATEQLSSIAPAFVELAIHELEDGRLAEAEHLLKQADRLAPPSGRSLLTRARIRQLEMSPDATDAFQAVLMQDPDNEEAERNLRFLNSESVEDGLALYQFLMAEERYREAMYIAHRCGLELTVAANCYRTILEAAGWAVEVKVEADGISISKVGGTSIATANDLRGMRVRKLQLAGSVELSDLSALAGAPIEVLNLSMTKAKDLSPLKGMPLKVLDLRNATVEDLEPLRGAPMEVINLKFIPATDLRPLAGMPLKQLHFTPEFFRHGIEVVRDCESLKRIVIEWHRLDYPPTVFDSGEAFWDWYTRGNFFSIRDD